MLAVAVREAKNQLSKYLRKVQSGEVVLITDRGRVVAQLAPPPLIPGSSEGELAALERLSHAGLVQIGSGQVKSASEGSPHVLPHDLDSHAVLSEIRGDR